MSDKTGNYFNTRRKAKLYIKVLVSLRLIMMDKFFFGIELEPIKKKDLEKEKKRKRFIIYPDNYYLKYFYYCLWVTNLKSFA